MTLQEAFSKVKDERRWPERKHDLQEMIVMANCAVLRGCDGWVDIADGCEDEERGLKTFLVLRHGRLETRRAVWVCDVSWMDEPMRAHAKKLGGVGMIESAQWIKGKTTLERRYFIVSAGLKTVEQFANAVRAHWGVETMHWGLDVTFREEDCRVCKGDGDRTLSALRKFALSALRLDKRHPERRLRRRRKLAARPPDYRAELLGLRKIPASNLAI